MAMNRDEKGEVVTGLAEKLSKAKAGLVAGFSGLDVAAVNEIRNKFRSAKVEYKVVKNTLMKRALAGTKIEKLSDAFTGPTAILFLYDEEFASLGKTAQEIKEKYEKFQVKAGYVVDDVLTGDAAATMAKMPTLAESRAQLLGVINAPATQLLSVFNAPAQQVVGVIQAKSEKKDAA